MMYCVVPLPRVLPMSTSVQAWHPGVGPYLCTFFSKIFSARGALASLVFGWDHGGVAVVAFLVSVRLGLPLLSTIPVGIRSFFFCPKDWLLH